MASMRGYVKTSDDEAEDVVDAPGSPGRASNEQTSGDSIKDELRHFYRCMEEFLPCSPSQRPRSRLGMKFRRIKKKVRTATRLRSLHEFIVSFPAG